MTETIFLVQYFSIIGRRVIFLTFALISLIDQQKEKFEFGLGFESLFERFYYRLSYKGKLYRKIAFHNFRSFCGQH